MVIDKRKKINISALYYLTHTSKVGSRVKRVSESVMANELFGDFAMILDLAPKNPSLSTLSVIAHVMCDRKNMPVNFSICYLIDFVPLPSLLLSTCTIFIDWTRYDNITCEYCFMWNTHTQKNSFETFHCRIIKWALVAVLLLNQETHRNGLNFISLYIAFVQTINQMATRENISVFAFALYFLLHISFFSVNFSYYLVLIQCFFGPLKCLRSALHIKLKIGILCVCLSFVFFSSGRSLEEKRAWIFSKKARIEATTCCILLCVNLELNCTTIYAYSMNKTKTLDHNRNWCRNRVFTMKIVDW